MRKESYSPVRFGNGGFAWWNKPRRESFLGFVASRVGEKTFVDYARYFERVPERFSVDDVVNQCRSSRWFCYVYSKIADYLWLEGKITLEERDRIKHAAKQQRRLTVVAHEVSLDSFNKTLSLFSTRPTFRIIYLVMYYSGARLEEAVHLMQNSKKETVDLGSAVRVIMNYNRGKKRCDYLYLPKQLYTEVINWKGEVSPRTISSYVKNYRKRKNMNMMQPSNVRKLNYQLMEQMGVDYEVRNFIQNRISKLSVGDRHYDNLLKRADEQYPTIAAKLKQLLDGGG